MKPKPQLKTEIAISIISRDVNVIWFYATPDAANEFGEFGQLMPSRFIANHYQLAVDTRYDFDEVINWIRDYGKPESEATND